MELSPEWREYARLQDALARRSKVDKASWGLEAALDCCVRALEAQPSTIPEALLVKRAERAGRSREAHRRLLINREALCGEAFGTPDQRLAERERLRTVFRLIAANERVLILGTAAGVEADTLASSLGITASAVRKKLQRFRAVARKAAA